MDPVTIGEDASECKCAYPIRELDFYHVPVLGEGRQVRGVISNPLLPRGVGQRLRARHIAQSRPTPIPVKPLMTRSE